ncbi:DUF3800 domain-containing protein [Flavobacterium sp. 14A]|uniref:DUF3800 domain-containing protein n=1 Tax=Flavobacterium sp. 14A TaxID=2735896 RepID=UPI001570DD43|nr:DUF3800 domain-containing protein [Flavobacterium sp. 14A]NRT12475.1 hypothetical protein [Flavobacterium sp. 14A]
MKKTFNIYCDESTHLQNDGMPFMMISYVSCAYPQLKIHKAYVQQLRAKHKFKGEIKWSAVSKSEYEFYADLIDYFFATDLMFRAVIVDKSKIDETRKDFTYNDFYFRMYYQLIYHKLTPENTFNIYLDIKDTCSQTKLVRLQELLNSNNNIRNIQFIKSYESFLMQLCDLIMGAINYHLRSLNKVTAKNRLIEKIQSHTKISLRESTPKSNDKFNLFYIDLK